MTSKTGCKSVRDMEMTLRFCEVLVWRSSAIASSERRLALSVSAERSCCSRSPILRLSFTSMLNRSGRERSDDSCGLNARNGCPPDPGLKLEDAPWPQLRTLLKDLIRINGARDDQHLSRTTDDAVGTQPAVSL